MITTSQANQHNSSFSSNQNFINKPPPFNIKKTPNNFKVSRQDMENEAREHLNLAHYNFNRMAIIHEEEIGDHISQPKSKQGNRI
jgi:hypothetical protein